MSINRIYGWRKQPYDSRDYKHEMLAKPYRGTLPTSLDLSVNMSPVYDQGQLGSCTANGIAGLLEYDRVITKRDVWTPSRLFIYWDERALEGTTNQDAGAIIRDGIKVVAQKGAPPETSWPYDITQFTVEAPPSVWGEAWHHMAGLYAAVNQDLTSLKTALAGTYPIVFGFTVYASFESDTVAQTGVVPMPNANEEVLGGHAVDLFGYFDNSALPAGVPSSASGGYFLVRNSWGSSWGRNGYFLMPYAYVTDSTLSDDFWTIHSYTDR